MQSLAYLPSTAGLEVRRVAGRGLPASIFEHLPGRTKPQRPTCAQQTPQAPHHLDDVTFRYALKEWGPACAALQSGEQLVIPSQYPEIKAVCGTQECRLPRKALQACNYEVKAECKISKATSSCAMQGSLQLGRPILPTCSSQQTNAWHPFMVYLKSM